jgi:hypothetical protein
MRWAWTALLLRKNDLAGKVWAQIADLRDVQLSPGGLRAIEALSPQIAEAVLRCGLNRRYADANSVGDLPDPEISPRCAPRKNAQKSLEHSVGSGDGADRD